MAETPQAGVKFGRHVWVGLGMAVACLAGFILIWPGLESAPKQPEEGSAMGQSSAPTTTPAVRPPIDLAAPATVETATFALG